MRATTHADSLHPHSFGNPSTILVFTLLNEDNYLIWSRSTRIALETKLKLGFINGKYKEPVDENTEEYEQ